MSTIGRKVNRPAQSELSIPEKPLSRSKFEDNFPHLFCFLSKRRDFGEFHQTGCLTLFIEGETLKVCLNDRPCRQSCFVSGAGLLEVLASADRGLLEGSHKWSKKGYQKRRGR